MKLRAAVLRAIAVVPCPQGRSNTFVEYVRPTFKHSRDVLMQQNQKLAQARDLLLPRLMNGEIAV